MILMNDDLDDFDVSLTTAAMKIGNIFTVFIATIAMGKNASLSNYMLNHPGHVTLTSQMFLKFLPVVGIIEIWKSGKYYVVTSVGSEFMAFLKNEKYYVFLDNFCLKQPLVLKIPLGIDVWL